MPTSWVENKNVNKNYGKLLGTPHPSTPQSTVIRGRQVVTRRVLCGRFYCSYQGYNSIPFYS